jgi:hypothetical protein
MSLNPFAYKKNEKENKKKKFETMPKRQKQTWPWLRGIVNLISSKITIGDFFAIICFL